MHLSLTALVGLLAYTASAQVQFQVPKPDLVENPIAYGSSKKVAADLDGDGDLDYVHDESGTIRFMFTLGGGRLRGAVAIERSSRFFADPEGSVAFDSALLMRGIDHRWVAHKPMRLS